VVNITSPLSHEPVKHIFKSFASVFLTD